MPSSSSCTFQASLSTSPSTSPPVARRDKGKGKDPALYDLGPQDGSEIQSPSVSDDELDDGARILASLAGESSAASGLLELGSAHLGSDSFSSSSPSTPDRELENGAQILAHLASTAHDLDSDSSSDDDEESSSDRRPFITSHKGTPLLCSAPAGNAIFDLNPDGRLLRPRHGVMTTQRYRLLPPHDFAAHRSRHGGRECAGCLATRAYHDARYERGHRGLGMTAAFEREDTVALDDISDDDDEDDSNDDDDDMIPFELISAMRPLPSLYAGTTLRQLAQRPPVRVRDPTPPHTTANGVIDLCTPEPSSSSSSETRHRRSPNGVIDLCTPEPSSSTKTTTGSNNTGKRTKAHQAVLHRMEQRHEFIYMNVPPEKRSKFDPNRPIRHLRPNAAKSSSLSSRFMKTMMKTTIMIEKGKERQQDAAAPTTTRQPFGRHLPIPPVTNTTTTTVRRRLTLRAPAPARSPAPEASSSSSAAAEAAAAAEEATAAAGVRRSGRKRKNTQAADAMMDGAGAAGPATKRRRGGR